MSQKSREISPGLYSRDFVGDSNFPGSICEYLDLHTHNISYPTFKCPRIQFPDHLPGVLRCFLGTLFPVKTGAEQDWVYLTKSGLVRVLRPPRPLSEIFPFSDEIWVLPCRIWVNINPESVAIWVQLRSTALYWDVQIHLFLIQMHTDAYRHITLLSTSGYNWVPSDLILGLPCSYHKGLEGIKMLFIGIRSRYTHQSISHVWMCGSSSKARCRFPFLA
jgi:hypothetical protein